MGSVVEKSGLFVVGIGLTLIVGLSPGASAVAGLAGAEGTDVVWACMAPNWINCTIAGAFVLGGCADPPIVSKQVCVTKAGGAGGHFSSVSLFGGWALYAVESGTGRAVDDCRWESNILQTERISELSGGCLSSKAVPYDCGAVTTDTTGAMLVTGGPVPYEGVAAPKSEATAPGRSCNLPSVVAPSPCDHIPGAGGCDVPPIALPDPPPAEPCDPPIRCPEPQEPRLINLTEIVPAFFPTNDTPVPPTSLPAQETLDLTEILRPIAEEIEQELEEDLKRGVDETVRTWKSHLLAGQRSAPVVDAFFERLRDQLYDRVERLEVTESGSIHQKAPDEPVAEAFAIPEDRDLDPRPEAIPGSLRGANRPNVEDTSRPLAFHTDGPDGGVP